MCAFDFFLMHWVQSFNWCSICGNIHGDSDLQSWKRDRWINGCIYLAHMRFLLSLPIYLPIHTTVRGVGSSGISIMRIKVNKMFQKSLKNERRKKQSTQFREWWRNQRADTELQSGPKGSLDLQWDTSLYMPLDYILLSLLFHSIGHYIISCLRH